MIEKADFTSLAWLTLLALGLTGALLRMRPFERSTYLNTLYLFVAGLAGEASVVLLAPQFPHAAAALHTAAAALAAIALIRMLGFAVFRLLLPLAGRRPTRIIEDLAIVVLYVVYGFAQLRAAGLDLSSLVTSSAILTAAIAFAMQDTLGNLLGGLAIQVDNTLQVGDWIRVDELVGQVRDIRWRSTLIETNNWETVVIPNSQLMKSRLAILGRREGAPLQVRRQLHFMVDPGVPPARVIALVEDEMRELAIPNVARSPGASCVLNGFEQGNLRYQLRYFLTRLSEDDLTDSMVRVHVFASLQRSGIRIAEPQNKVHAVHGDEAHAESVRRRELTRRQEMLRAVELFSPLSEAELSELAERLQYAPFARGDLITRQGDAAHWLYIVAFGEAEVRYEPQSGAAQTVGVLHPGQIFGEMGLLAGEARHATVVAKTDVECYRLDKASFQSLLLKRPEITDEVSRIVGSRKSELDLVREALPGPKGESGGERQAKLLARMRRFFGLQA